MILWIYYWHDILLGTWICETCYLKINWWHYVGYDDYELVMQMIDFAKWWMILFMRILNNDPKYDS